MIPQYEPFTGDTEKRAIIEYLDNPGFWTEYKHTREFEERIEEYLKVDNAIVVNNGTISLSIALLSLGVKAGDNIIVPDMTMIATPNAVRFIGANPIFIDIDERGLLNFELADKAIEEYDIKAVIFVSLNGRSFNANGLEYINKWKNKNIGIIDDAAQSFGSKIYNGKFCGTFGCDIGSFSFSMPKIITTGQGGCLVTNNNDLAKKIRKTKDFGRSSGGCDIHETFGINSKFTELQAVLGKAQLCGIDYRVNSKKEMFEVYRNNLKDIPQITFIETNLDIVTPWFIDIFVDDPDGLASFLKTKGIGTRRVYPPIHSQRVYSYWNRSSFPMTEYFSKKGLWLPSSFKLTKSDIDKICNTIKEYYG